MSRPRRWAILVYRLNVLTDEQLEDACLEARSILDELSLEVVRRAPSVPPPLHADVLLGVPGPDETGLNELLERVEIDMKRRFAQASRINDQLLMLSTLDATARLALRSDLQDALAHVDHVDGVLRGMEAREELG